MYSSQKLTYGFANTTWVMMDDASQENEGAEKSDVHGRDKTTLNTNPTAKKCL